jgi:RHS repeat-associated protein
MYFLINAKASLKNTKKEKINYFQLRFSWKDFASFVLLTFAVFILCSDYAYAQSDKDNVVPLPEILGKSRSVQVVSAFGTVSESIPIVVSPGRRNIQPQLALSYNSMGGLGDAGLGWQLSIGAVSRWRGDGTPTAGDPNTYSYALAGAGGKLIPTEGGVYRTETESIYREFKFEDGRWVMDNGEGIKHYFGSSEESRIAGELWLLDYVKDGSGNTTTYQYMNDDGALYIDRILYTGYEPTEDTGTNRIEFDYEPRPERNERIYYDNSNLKERKKRLKSIAVFTMNNKLVRRYELGYQQSELNGQSLIENVTLVGDDGVSEIILRTFEYGTRSLEVPDTVANTLPVDLAVYDEDLEGGLETGARLIDVNGDGFSDVVENETIDGLHRIHLGDGEGGFNLDNGWSTSLAAADIRFIIPDGDHRGADEGVRLMDVNGDGLPDIFIARPDRKEVWINTVNGWQFNAGWTANLNALKATVTVDNYYKQEDCERWHCDDPFWEDQPDCIPHCEGTEDDPPDCLPPHCDDPPYCLVTPDEDCDDPPDCLQDHCESGEEIEHDEEFALVDVGGDSKGVKLVDVNADGRVDIVWSMTRTDELFTLEVDGEPLERVPLKIREVWLNNGSGWQPNEVLKLALIDIGDEDGYGIEFVKDSQILGYDLMDVNGDGLADIVGTFEDTQSVFLGTGSGWEEDETYYSVSLEVNNLFSLNEDRQGQGLMPVDFNDDGLVDYLQANETMTRAFYNTGKGWEESVEMADILSSLGIAFNTSDGKPTGTVISDIDGDGIIDYVKAYKEEGGDSERWLTLSDSKRSGLLVRAKTATGEETTRQWNISTELDNKQGGIEGVPTPRPIATALTRYDGRGNSYTDLFNYGGGLFEDRQFRGFAWSELTRPKGLLVKRLFYQDKELFGSVSNEEWYDGVQLKKKVSTSYEIIEQVFDGKTLKQVRLLQIDNEIIDPGGTDNLKMRLKYEHDDRLNATSVYRDQDLDKTGDESTTFFTWAFNPDAGIWSLPVRIEAIQGTDGEILSEFIMYYDDLDEGEAIKGLPHKAKYLVETGGLGGVMTYVEKSMEYDEYGNIVLLKNREGKDYLFVYDDLTYTFRTMAIDPEGIEVESEYDPGFDRLVWNKDASGNETVKEYDTFGRLIKVTLPGDEGSPFGTRYYEYSEYGDANAQYYRVKETETPGEGGTFDTTKFFDGMGRVYRLEKEGPAEKKVVIWAEFDDADNPVVTSRPFFEGEPELVTHITRDKLHRPVSVIEPDGIELTMEYAGMRADVTDRRGFMTSFYHNADGKTTKTRQWVDGGELVTKYLYDARGRLTTIIDALDEETRIAYDALSRRVRLEDPNAGTYTYNYDGEGNLIEQNAPGDDHPTVFVYNDAGDLIRKEFPDGTYQAITYGEPGQQNAVGRVTQIEDAAGVVEMSYDVRGNVVERRRTALGKTFVTGYSYDSMSRIRRMTYPDSFTVNYEYDTGGNLARVTDGKNREIAAYTNHNAAGQFKESDFGNGVLSSFTYDDLLRMDSIKTQTSLGDTLQDMVYEYDAGSNVKNITDNTFGASQEFWYDEISRLTKAVGAYGEEDYEYDAIGNLLRKGSLIFEVDPDHLQRIICGVDLSQHVGKGTSKNPDGGACSDADSSGFRSFSLDYDEKGNVIKKGDKRYEYDAENHIVRVSDANGKVLEENTYDLAGQRVIQQKRNDTTVFIDGIYEENKTHASRHVRAGPLLVATVMMPRTTIRLIDAAPPPLYGLGGSIQIWNMRTMADNWHWIFTTLAVLAIFLYFLVPDNRKSLQSFIAILAESFVRVRQCPGKAAFILLFIPLFTFVISCDSAGSLGVGQSYRSKGKGFNSEKRYYYHSNHLGSINVVTDDKGKVVERRDYKPYGDRFEWTGPESGPRELLTTFNGQRYDDTIGLYYFGARHYDPEMGRFLNSDTQVPNPMDPKSLNRYAFAAGNPIRYTDPTGHGFWDWFWGIVIVVAAIVIGIILLVVAVVLAVFELHFLAFLVGVAGFALIGGGIGGIVAMAIGGGEFDWGAFWIGFGIGAAIGALLLVVIVLALAQVLEPIVRAIQLIVDFIDNINGTAYVGATLVDKGEVVRHVADGGEPDKILTRAVGKKVFLTMLKNASGIPGINLDAVEMYKEDETIATALGAKENGGGGTLPNTSFRFNPGLYKNSPAKALGIPGWVFRNTWIGYGNNQQNSPTAPLLQTMPLAP